MNSCTESDDGTTDDANILFSSSGEPEDGIPTRSSPSSSEQETDDPQVLREIDRFLNSFEGLQTRYRVISKIGEGTFSSVYKAVDLHYHRYLNKWDVNDLPDMDWSIKGKREESRSEGQKPKYVAIKKIYATSSPLRIQNELELLRDLAGSDTVVSLVTAFRHQDQVVVIMPYFHHADFRDYFRTFKVRQMQEYFRQLFGSLAHVHKHGILHRDIKPTNFLYDVKKERGVLVDFGLAEVGQYAKIVKNVVCVKQCPFNGDRQFNLLTQTLLEVISKLILSVQFRAINGIRTNAKRPMRRANRAGTRGFRAPEVLFKCASQTTKIDIWSAGVILLTFLSRRFPFFNSADDIDAIIEIATMFGRARMRACAALHGATFETNIGTIGEKGFTLEKIVHWASAKPEKQLTLEELLAVDFLGRCLDLDPLKRISAEEALRHSFLQPTNSNNSKQRGEGQNMENLQNAESHNVDRVDDEVNDDNISQTEGSEEEEEEGQGMEGEDVNVEDDKENKGEEDNEEDEHDETHD